MRGAGCTWNDITDRDFDAAVARTRSRPIPSGQVSPRGAAIWLVLQLAIGAAILLTFPAAAIALGIAALIPVAVYPLPNASPGGRRPFWVSPSTGARCWPLPPVAAG